MVRAITPAAFALSVALSAGATVYAADSPGDKDYQACVKETGVPACTRVISSGQFDGSRLAALHSLRAKGFASQGDPDRAILDFSEAIRLRPDFAAAFNDRGVQYDLEGDYELAIVDYNKAIFLDSEGFGLRAGNNRAIAYFHKRDDDGAIANFGELMVRFPSSQTAYVYRGAIYLVRGEYDRAIADFDAYTRLDPDPGAAFGRYGRGLARLKKGDTEGGNADIAAAKALRADVVEEWDRRYGNQPSGSAGKFLDQVPSQIGDADTGLPAVTK